MKSNRRQPKALKAARHSAADLQNKLTAFLSQHCPPNVFLLIGLSGGVDSVVLLHALTQFQTIQKSEHVIQLQAMHIHHGLSAEADHWAAFCEALCEKHHIPFVIEQVNIDKNSGLGVEATARQARYKALSAYQFEGVAPDFIVTAHHQHDQAETLLLQLFRGAGAKGLAAMAEVDRERRLLRPLLNIPKTAILQYAQVHNLQWCEDDSNKNTAFDRNFLRHSLIPQIETRYPALQASLARTAAHMAETQTLLNDLAQIDANLLIHQNSICLKGLAALDEARAKNVLRWWFASNALTMPSTDFLSEILTQLLAAKSDALIKINIQQRLLQRYQQRAYLNQPNSIEAFDLVWTGQPIIDLPDGGQLQFKRAIGTGLAVKHGVEKLRITNRKGGERFKPEANRPSRTLKHLLQSVSMPPWERERIPLIYWQDDLAYVPEVGATQALKASEGEEGIVIAWVSVSQ